MTRLIAPDGSRRAEFARRLRRPHTLRGRVSALAAAVIFGWLVVLAVVFDLVIASRLSTQVNDELRVRAQAASATVVVSNGRITGVRESNTDSELDASIWVFAGTRALERPNSDGRRQRAAQGLAAGPQGFHEVRDERFYVLPVTSHGQRIGSIVAAIDREPYDHTRDIVVGGSVLVVLLGAAGSFPVLALATRRALQPVARMTEQAAEWSVNNPDQRFGDGQGYAELSSLAARLDDLLDRLAAVLRHERQLSAELSHELRTPLARVAGEVELMLPAATGELREGLLAVRADCAAMDSMMDTLLAAARSELVGTVGRCALDPVLRTLAAGDPRVRVHATTLTAGVEADLVERMLAPVVTNASRYAQTTIDLRATRAGNEVAVEVSNDGPRLDPALAERVFEPGFRAGGDTHDGAGLGLALARRLARSADGDLVVDAAAARTTFRLTLPTG